MKLIINPIWTFEEVFNASHEAYIGSGITSQGYRNSVLMAWGNVVGKKRALDEFNRLVKEYGNKKSLAEAMKTSPATLRKIENHFLQLPEPFSIAPSKLRIKFVRANRIAIEEDLEYELKEIKLDNRNPVSSIINTCERYLVSFLNSEGGRILWGITNDRTVRGVRLISSQRDELRRGITSKIAGIQPAIDPTAFRLSFHPVLESGGPTENLFIIEVDVPKSNTRYLYFTGSNETFVRLQGVSQKLTGPAIQEWIERRIYPRSTQF